jgi:hypothetical protein
MWAVSAARLRLLSGLLAKLELRDWNSVFFITGSCQGYKQRLVKVGAEQ